VASYRIVNGDYRNHLVAILGNWYDRTNRGPWFSYAPPISNCAWRDSLVALVLAGIDLLTGKVHALVKDRHRSREFIEFLKLLDTAYPAGTAIKVILDNHSAHISRETQAWLATQPADRFAFTFTPKRGSWLNLIEGFFSKFARSVLRHNRVASKQELKERIMLGIKDVNRYPVIHTWPYKLAEAA
jgi:transposase